VSSSVGVRRSCCTTVRSRCPCSGVWALRRLIRLLCRGVNSIYEKLFIWYFGIHLQLDNAGRSSLASYSCISERRASSCIQAALPGTLGMLKHTRNPLQFHWRVFTASRITVFIYTIFYSVFQNYAKEMKSHLSRIFFWWDILFTATLYTILWQILNVCLKPTTSQRSAGTLDVGFLKTTHHSAYLVKLVKQQKNYSPTVARRASYKSFFHRDLGLKCLKRHLLDSWLKQIAMLLLKTVTEWCYLHSFQW